MSQFDFDDVSEYFEFKLGGHDYRLKYPTTEEMEQAQKLKPERRSEWVLSFISPVNPEGTPSLMETMKKVSVKVSREFLKRISQEFNLVD